MFGLVADWESRRKESALKQDRISRDKESPAVAADDPNLQNGSAFYNAVMTVHHYAVGSVERELHSHEVQRGIANRFHRTEAVESSFSECRCSHSPKARYKREAALKDLPAWQ